MNYSKTKIIYQSVHSIVNSKKKKNPMAEHDANAVTPEAIGWAGWTILHTTAAAFPNSPSEAQKKDMRDFIRSWSRVYPCSICAFHMRNQLRTMPPDVASKRALSRWTCEMHNSVNSMLGKETYDCDPDKVLRRWHPTYPHMDDEPTPEELLEQARKASPPHQQQQQQQPGGLTKGAMKAGWGAKSDGGNSGVPDDATDTDAVLRRLSSCKAFCPEKKEEKK